MAQFWAEQGVEGTRETVADTPTLALHVLTCVGFSLSYSFHHGVRDLPDGHSMKYRDALSLCLRNIIIFAAQEFQKYMEEMLNHERNMAAKRERKSNGLTCASLRGGPKA